jgi:transcriptional regulator with XRE-family HTH domain
MPTSSRKLLKQISTRVRHERTRLGLSQQEVAERANVSRRMLAAIEGEQSNVSLATLDRIAAALNLKFADLLRDSPVAPSAIPVVAWQGRTKDSRAVLLQSAPAVSGIELWEWSLAPGDRYKAEPDRAGMREQIYVVAGVLTLHLEGKVHRLAVGDSLMFGSDRRYEYRNAGKVVTRFLKNVVE